MKLTLNFFLDKGGKCPARIPQWDHTWECCERELNKCVLLPPPRNGDADPRLDGVDEMWYVSAVLSDGEWGRRWHLQIRGERDEYFNRVEKDGHFVYSSHDEDDDADTRQLFRGAPGVVLLCLTSGKDASDVGNTQLSVWMKIDPSPFRRELLFAMAAELAASNPFLLYSTPHGSSRHPVTRKVERRGGERHACLRIEIEMISWLMGLLTQCLQLISRAPLGIVECTAVKKPAFLVRYPTVRAMCQLRQHGWSWGDANTRIDDRRRLYSTDIVPHRVIKWFLLRRRDRLVAIAAMLKQYIGRWETDPVFKQMLNDELFQNRHDEYRRELESDRALYAKVTSEMLPTIDRMVARGPWSVSRDPVSIFDADAAEFGTTPEYQKLHTIMIMFESVNNFWSDVEGNSLFVNYHMSRDDGRGQSRWMRNYSRIYEGWAFRRMLLAFDRLYGEDCANAMSHNYFFKLCQRGINTLLNQRVNDPICIVSNGLRIELFYGVIAPNLEDHGWDDVEYSGERFPFRCSQGGGYAPDHLEPDFVLCFTDVKSNRKHMIVIDAKSSRVLHYKGGVEAREKYKYCFLRFTPGADGDFDQKPPDQSWLLYNGNENLAAGIEFNAETQSLDSTSWDTKTLDTNNKPKMENFAPARMNSPAKVVWSENGIVGLERVHTCLVGHVRCNALTVTENDAIAEFIRVEEASVRRLFKLDQPDINR